MKKKNHMNNKAASQVKVYAYLTPDPLDEDSCLETECMEWLPGFDSNEDSEDGMHPFHRDENIALFKSIEFITVIHFRKSLKNLFPLLQDHLFDHIQIAIDHQGLISRGTSMAAYDYGNSSPEMGKYVMHASQEMIASYINVDYDWTKLSLKKSLVWEHEIIHLLDTWEVVRSCVYKSSNSAENKFTYYLLSYRIEGIAELYYLLNAGYKEINSVEAATKAFQKGIQQVQQRMAEGEMSKDDWERDVFSDMDCYEAGPWLLLDMLRSFEGYWHEELIDEALNSITAGKPLERSKILEIVKIALRVKLEYFLEYIKPLVPEYRLGVPAALTNQLVLN
jgi:hypothetical protein